MYCLRIFFCFGRFRARLTTKTTTNRYRAPELLLSTKQYHTPIDMWSVGCIFAELLRKVPLFSAKTEIDLLRQIVATLGPPQEGKFPDQANKNFTFSKFKSKEGLLRGMFPREQAIQTTGYYLSNTGFDLLRSFLDYDPKTRINADQALRHPYVV